MRTVCVWLWTTRNVLKLLAVSSLLVIRFAAVPLHASADAGCDFVRPDVRFDCPGHGRGFAITNDGARRLLDVYDEFGGEAKLGPVASCPFKDPRIPGFWLHATPNFILQIKD